MGPVASSVASQRWTIGILFSGEMGSTLGHYLLTRGARVVTTLEGRSDRSARLCKAAGLEVLDSLGDVVRTADVLLSVVTPAAATALAERVAFEVARRPARTLYIDANSVSPITMRGVESILDLPNVEVVDASIHGLASRLIGEGTLYLSGPAAAEVAALFRVPLRVVVLGEDIGRASLMKMLIGGVNKGLVALLFELSDVALAYDVLDEFWEVIGASYGGVMEPFERLLPTYPQHVARRASEMAELELTLSAVGKTPILATAVRTVFQIAADSPALMETLTQRMAKRWRPPESSRGS
jgi:3-hydroxyisobutyrate dehydrogenase-like beta-hydroxyacid dehydrogenase